MLKLLFTPKIVGSLVRHAVTAVGGFMVASGLVDPVADAAALEAIAGGAVALAGLGWSMLEKARR
jgi:hypothetical protein